MNEVQFSDFRSIVSDVDYCDGQPRIIGTRITVSAILSYLAGGMSIDEILAAFPVLRREDVVEALGFATLQLQVRYLPLKKQAV